MHACICCSPLLVVASNFPVPILVKKYIEDPEHTANSTSSSSLFDCKFGSLKRAVVRIQVANMQVACIHASQVVYARTHACIHICTHTHMRVSVRAHARMRARAHVCMYSSHAYIHACSHACVHPCMHACFRVSV